VFVVVVLAFGQFLVVFLLVFRSVSVCSSGSSSRLADGWADGWLRHASDWLSGPRMRVSLLHRLHTIVGFGGAVVECSPFVPWVPGSSPGLGIPEIYFSSPYTVRRRGVDLQNLCLRTNVWIAAAQALVAAITGEANRLLSLDLSSLGDGSQFPEGPL
jgi:hypothetical protein